jgi:hypothetical protein
MKVAPSFVLMTTLLFAMPSVSTLKAADFDWMVNLNLRSHSDPYTYRYGLMDRFRYNETEVVYIMDSVYEPADAYMIFRLAELSNRPPEYVLRVYRERRFRQWDDFALYLGIPVYAPMFTSLRHGHDIVYRERPHVRYEEYHHAEPRHYSPPVRVYVEQPRREVEPHREHRVEPQRHDDRRIEQPRKESHDSKHNRDRKDDNPYDRH